MKNQNLTATITVGATPQGAFMGINNVSNWWAPIEGHSQKVNDVFTVRFGKVFITHKVTELVPSKKVVWSIIDTNAQDWVKSKIVFEILQEGDVTGIQLTHVGMTPGKSDYNDCVKGWTTYFKGSLFELLTNDYITKA